MIQGSICVFTETLCPHRSSTTERTQPKIGSSSSEYLPSRTGLYYSILLILSPAIRLDKTIIGRNINYPKLFFYQSGGSNAVVQRGAQGVAANRGPRRRLHPIQDGRQPAGMKNNCLVIMLQFYCNSYAGVHPFLLCRQGCRWRQAPHN